MTEYLGASAIADRAGGLRPEPVAQSRPKALIPSAPCCEAFRKAGFTGAACNFPLTPEGAGIVAEHNGLTVEQIPDTWHYAPNAYMQAWLNDLGARRAQGETVRVNGRWVS